MSLRTVLIAGMPFTALLAAPAVGADVVPGGQLSLTISGFARFLTAYGDLDKKPRNSFRLPEDVDFRRISSFDFLTETEVHVLALGQHEPTGIQYGATIELRADTFNTRNEAGEPENGNSDETWIFVRGGFGELRFGDTDSAANNMKIGAYTVAVGSGGIDGSIVGVTQPVLIDLNRDTEDNTKAIYYSPVLGGFQFGLSYLPHEGSIGDTLSFSVKDEPEARDDVVTAGVSYTTSLGASALRTSLVGATDLHDITKTYAANLGAVIDIGDFSVAGSLGMRKTDGLIAPKGNPSVFPNPGTAYRRSATLGVQYRFDPAAFSITYGWSDAHRGKGPEDQERTNNIVFGVELALLPGMTLSTEFERFDIKRFTSVNDNNKDNDGWLGITRLALAF